MNVIRDRFHQQRHYLLAAFVLAAVYVIFLALVSPQHEFPLNDDWAYAQTVRHLLDTGELRISEWASATAVVQTYVGALLTQLTGGFSFSALRVTTLLFSFFGSLGLYDLLLQLGISPRAAILGSLALIANPIYIYLSYTFMSDVYFFALLVWSLGWYTRGLRRGQNGALWVGALLAAAAYLSRQLAVVLPIAALIAWWLKYRRWDLWTVLAIAALPAMVLIGHTVWLRYFHGLPWGLTTVAMGATLDNVRQPRFWLELVVRVLWSLIYVGMFVLPLVLAQLLSLKLDRARLRWLTKVYGLWLMTLGLLTIFLLVVSGNGMPYLANVINRDGLGPLTLPGHKVSIIPDWVFWLVTVVAPLVGAALAALVTEAVRHARREGQEISATLLIASLGMAPLSLMLVVLWDEYLIVLIPAGTYLVLRLGSLRWRGWWLGLSACLVLTCFSLVELIDHFAWTTARWDAGVALAARGIRPDEIDGGFEWTGWYEFETALPIAIARGQQNDLLAWTKVTPKPYILAFEPIHVDGLEVIDRIYYPTALGRWGSLYVLQWAERP